MDTYLGDLMLILITGGTLNLNKYTNKELNNKNERNTEEK